MTESLTYVIAYLIAFRIAACVVVEPFDRAAWILAGRIVDLLPSDQGAILGVHL